MTQTIDVQKIKSRKTPKRAARRATAQSPPEQARKRANATPRRPKASSPPQPRVRYSPRPTAEEPQPRTRPKISPSRRPSASPPAEEPSTAPTAPITQTQALQEMVRRANEGNAACLAGLRKFLDANPTLWQQAGDVSALAERNWIELLADGNKLVEESIPRRLRAIKAELAGPAPTPLEALLVDVIGISWLAAMHGEVVAAQSGGSIQQAHFRQRRAESTQRRLLRATKTLAIVRTLSAKGIEKRVDTRASGPCR